MSALIQKPGGIEEVNSFLSRIGRHDLVPMVHCETDTCFVLISQKKPRAHIINKKGNESHPRLCKKCLADRQARGETVLVN